MGKAKKNRRQQQAEDSPDEQEKDIVVPVAPVAGKGKKKKANKNRFQTLDSDSGDDVKDSWDADEEASSVAPPIKKKQNAFALLDDDDTTDTVPSSKSKSKKKNAFALLGDDSDTAEEVSSKVEEAHEPQSAIVVDPFDEDSEEDTKRKKKKGKQNQAPVEATGDGEVTTVKTKAQKAAEKKERERKKREQAKAKKNKDDDEFAAALADAGVVLADNYEADKKPAKKKKKKKKEAEETESTVDTPEVSAATEGRVKESPAEKETEPTEDKPAEEKPAEGEEDEGEEEGTGKKKKKKKKKGAEAKPKVPTARAKKIKEALDALAAEKERIKREEEEAELVAQKAEEERLEQIRLEEERKQKKKDKEKERKERKKKEGTWLSKAEKEKQARSQAALEAMKQQGIIVPDKATETQKPVGKVRYGGRQRKKKPQQKEDQIAEAMEDKLVIQEPEKKREEIVTPTDSWEMLDTPKDDVVDAWDASDAESGKEETPTEKVEVEEQDEDDDEEEESDSESESEDEEEEESGSESESDDEDLPPRQRMEARRVRAENTKDPNVLRAPILCVLGHVDTGKTTILDKFRKTNVQEGEAGGITQQIGATNVPLENILKECEHLNLTDLKIPGMLIIDTPGHESFSNLRSRGSSLCDMAILVVDVMHGLEQQTIESLNLLKKRRTPFVIALNKIDRLYEWKTMPKVSVEECLKKQKKITRDEFEDRSKQAMVQIAEQGLNAKLFYENPDFRSYISVVPVSGYSGDGMADLLSLVCELSQKMLGPQLIYKDCLEAMVMEVKAIHGLGTTVDIILRNGKVSEGDTLILSGIEGAFSTTVRAVLTPHPMKEMRVKNNFVQHKVVKATQGIKICARDMEKTLAGMPVYISRRPDEAEVLIADANKALKEELKSIKLSSEGVYVQASTLGSLEALLEFLKESKIKYSGVSIGPVHKKDIMKASVMLQHDKEFACLLAFDVKVERDAQETADSLGVRIFTADIIYHLFDQFMAYKEELKNRRKEQYRNNAVFPCRLRVIPTCVFNTRDPIVLGVTVINGVLRAGTPLCVPSKEFCYIGVVTSLEMNNKQVDTAQSGHDVCIKIENIGGDAPKLYGRHFDENDVLVSKITRDSIDTLKEYFRDDMSKSDWKLIVELKKIFEIL